MDDAARELLRELGELERRLRAFGGNTLLRDSEQASFRHYARGIGFMISRRLNDEDEGQAVERFGIGLGLPEGDRQ